MLLIKTLKLLHVHRYTLNCFREIIIFNTKLNPKSVQNDNFSKQFNVYLCTCNNFNVLISKIVNI